MSEDIRPANGSGAAASLPPAAPPVPDRRPPRGGCPLRPVTRRAPRPPAFWKRAAVSSYGDLPAFLAGVTPVDVHGDVIESPAPRTRRPLALALTAAAVVLVVLLGGGALAAARWWNGPVGTLPEDLVPGSVAAFARIDLSPGIGQRLKVEALLRRSGGSGTKSIDDAKHDIFGDPDAPIGYDDIASWFDDRAGIAMWADPQDTGKPVTLLVLSSRDDAKARTALTAAQLARRHRPARLRRRRRARPARDRWQEPPAARHRGRRAPRRRHRCRKRRRSPRRWRNSPRTSPASLGGPGPRDRAAGGVPGRGRRREDFDEEEAFELRPDPPARSRESRRPAPGRRRRSRSSPGCSSRRACR